MQTNDFTKLLIKLISLYVYFSLPGILHFCKQKLWFFFLFSLLDIFFFALLEVIEVQDASQWTSKLSIGFLLRWSFSLIHWALSIGTWGSALATLTFFIFFPPLRLRTNAISELQENVSLVHPRVVYARTSWLYAHPRTIFLSPWKQAALVSLLYFVFSSNKNFFLSRLCEYMYSHAKRKMTLHTASNHRIYRSWFTSL